MFKTHDRILVCEVKGELTLCFDRVADGAGVAQAVRIGRSHQEQVDGAGLQILQDEALGLHVIRERLPAATRRMAAVHTHIKHEYLYCKLLQPKLYIEILSL